MKKYEIIGIGFWVTQSWLLGVPEFTLPVGTPGRQENGMGQPIIQNGIQCEHVIVPGTTCELFFPIDGSQPSTQDAGEWSGARYNAPDNNRVTDWWVRVFGGNKAVHFSRDGGDPYFDPKMGFVGKKLRHIIRVDTTIAGTPAGFEQQFWRTFRDIAADPVGRVLLYRLLIEIRRTDNVTHNGCCGDGIALPGPDLSKRNNCRNLIVIYNVKSSFNFKRATLKLNPAIKQQRVLKQNNNALLTTEADNRTGDVSLFHEMLHWFHHLRNNQKISEGKKCKIFPYSAKFYYGTLLELNLWGLKNFNIKEEEIATILGIPDYNNRIYQNLMPSEMFPLENDGMSFLVQINGRNQYIPHYGRYLNGYDLSENAYRCSKTETGVKHLYMRFGHSSKNNMMPVSMNPIPNRFQLAHRIAINCYLNITGIQAILRWNLTQGEAIK